MTDTQRPEKDIEQGSELERRLRMSKRGFVRALLAGAATYSMPLMVSFSMEGLRVGQAHAQGLKASNQTSPGFSGANQGFSAGNQGRGGGQVPFSGANQRPLRSR